MPFADKVVLITGASSGVGADAARHFSTLSAKLVLIGRNAAKLQQTADICQQNSGLTPLSIVADVTNDEDVERIVNSTKQHYGRLDVLINNAGIAPTDNILELSMEIYDQIMNTNLRSVFNLTRLAVPMLIESKGNIVNISSAASVKPSPQLLTYSVSKSALDSFSRTIALQLAPKKVRVNSIVLGYVQTGIQEKFGLDMVFNKEEYLKLVPLREFVNVEDVSKLMSYLASDAAKAITGHYVALDGGWSST